MAKNTEVRELAEKAAKGCRLVFQDGGFMGDDWYELVGSGVDILKELLDKHGSEGLSAFNAAFESVLERELKSQIKERDEAFKALLPRVVGAPYDMREIAELRARGADTSKLVTTEDYHATVDLRDSYQGFLSRYRSGEQMEVYIPAGVPETFRSEVVRESWAMGRIPKGKTIILQRPKEEETS